MAVIETNNVIPGTAYPLRGAGAPVNGTTGTGAEKGSTYQDTTNGKVYVNTGTAAATVWTVAGTQT